MRRGFFCTSILTAGGFESLSDGDLDGFVVLLVALEEL